MKTGGQLIVEALEANRVERVFGVPGESYLAVLDALTDSAIDFVTCRQEGGAAMMADAHGKLTGKPGICFVTRAPGATNASAGVHIADQDSTPMILFVGQIGRDIREREAFQEVDYRAFFGDMTKWVAEIDDARRIPELVTRAFAVATSGRPGPVVLALPEDMLTDQVDAPAALPSVQVVTAPSPDTMAKLVEMLANAKSPVMVLGGSGWNEQAVADIRGFAEAWQLPVGCSFRRQMLFDHIHPNYAGDVGIGINPALATRIKQADVVLLVGGRLGEMPSSNYTLLKSPYPDQTLIHVHADASELGRVYRPTLAIHANPPAFAASVAALAPVAPINWPGQSDIAHDAYLRWSTPPEPKTGGVDMGAVMTAIEQTMPDDTIFTNGAGNYATWLHRFHRFRRFATQASPTSGSMGYGLPAAIAAKLAFPQREVVCFAGDGCFMMTCQELATACQQRLRIVILVINNGIFGTIRMHQEREYPHRVSGTALANPDFAALARAFGGHGETVRETGEFTDALARARAFDGPAVIEIVQDPEQITPARTLSEFSASQPGI
jgi:acetolactate synthase-1/2/3 large subunit